MKFLKNIVSIFISISIVITIFQFTVFSNEITYLNNGEYYFKNYDGTDDNKLTSVYYKFTPSSSDYYEFYIMYKQDDYNHLSDELNVILNSTNKITFNQNNKTIMYLEANKDYIININHAFTFNTPTVLKLCLTISKHIHNFNITSDQNFKYYKCKLCSYSYNEKISKINVY